MDDEKRNSQKEELKLAALVNLQKQLKQTNETLVNINKLNIKLVERVDTLTDSVFWVSFWLVVSIILFASFYFWEVEILSIIAVIVDILAGNRS
ncbi:hypothetical protein N9R34_01535 [Candidatus Thioglobus sp.]|nr:hypothetical protein [Candidatus Thioglobus sp.]